MRLASVPPTYRPMRAVAAHHPVAGTTTGSGLVAQAVPTARTAFGLPGGGGDGRVAGGVP